MNIRLIILGLLSQSSMHGYEIQKWLETSDASFWADVKSGSIYHALRKMEQEELIEIHSKKSVGNRSKAIYSITKNGRNRLRELLESGWSRSTSSYPSSLYVLLTFYDLLPLSVLEECMKKQIDLLKQEMQRWKQGEEIKMKEGVMPKWGKWLFENGRAHLYADIELLEKLLLQMQENRDQ